jgi:hypothetical protein
VIQLLGTEAAKVKADYGAGAIICTLSSIHRKFQSEIMPSAEEAAEHL